MKTYPSNLPLVISIMVNDKISSRVTNPKGNFVFLCKGKNF